MISLMKENLLNYGLKDLFLKIDVTQWLEVLRRMSKSTATAGIEGRKPSQSTTYAMYENLKELCLDNSEFFANDESENGQRLYAAFIGLNSHIDTISPLVDKIRKVAARYDFDEQTPGNGYRSFVFVADASIIHGVKLCRQIMSSRESFLFRKGFYSKEIEACSHFVASLSTCFIHLNTLVEWCDSTDLFPNSDRTPTELLSRAENINQYCFYGRCLGIQFCESMQNVLKSISIFMASFSETYYSTGGIMATANCVLTGGKYLIDPELRARRIVNISQYASIDFCKAFWFLAESELMKKLPSIVCSNVAVNKEISLAPEPLEMVTNSGTTVSIPVPSSHIGTRPIQVRLLSNRRREGMLGEEDDVNKKGGTSPPSPGLIVHCHGGGFVAQSSQSHEVYLRDWASAIDVPILSIDYSLAPEAPFPRALEEVFYAYCWAVKNCDLLGSTGERIILAGDSAGGNLNLGLALKTIDYDVRKPSGLFLAYVPVLVSFVPSPARLLCLMDPLLPFGFMMRCLKAYASPDNQKKCDALERRRVLEEDVVITNGDKHSPNSPRESETESFEEVSESDLLELVGHTSPPTDSITSKPEADQQTTNPNPPSCFKLDLNCLHTSSSNVNSYIFDSEVKNGQSVPVVKTSDIKNESPTSKWNLKSFFSKSFTASTSSVNSASVLDGSCARSPSEEFQFTVPKDPFLSPYWAQDDILKQFPPVSICTVQFDPCLDDCVMFAKKLKKLGNCIKLDILDGLPHGFLNFTMVSREAYEGSKICVKRIKDLLDIESITPQDNMLPPKFAASPTND